MATTSLYQYLTVTTLELSTGLDYSVINAVFTDTVICGAITTAEELINAILDVSTAQTVTNQITSAVKFGAAWQMNYLMNALGIKFEVSIYDVSWDKMHETLEKILAAGGTVDSIPMSGANRFYSTRRWV